MLQHPSICFTKFASSPQRITFVDLFFVLVLNEVFGEFLDVGKALQTRIHKASVAEVAQADDTFSG